MAVFLTYLATTADVFDLEIFFDAAFLAGAHFPLGLQHLDLGGQTVAPTGQHLSLGGQHGFLAAAFGAFLILHGPPFFGQHFAVGGHTVAVGGQQAAAFGQQAFFGALVDFLFIWAANFLASAPSFLI